jgi:hypothetical protein
MRSWARVGDVLLVLFVVGLAIVSIQQLRLNAKHGAGPHDRPIASASSAPR